MRVCAPVILVLAWLSVSNAQPQPDSTPAARRWMQGLEARKDKLDRLMGKLKQGAEGSDSKTAGGVPRSLGCPVALESALMVALTDGHVVDGKNEEFHLIIKAKREKEYLDVGYVYNLKGTLVGTAISRLPAGWSVGFQPGELSVNKFMIVADPEPGCIFEFDSTDPFASKTVASEHE